MSHGYEIIDKSDGYYLKVTGKINLGALVQEINHLQIASDMTKLKEITQAEVGDIFIIAAKSALDSDTIDLTISPSKMQAYLSLDVPPGEKIKPEEVFKVLEAAGVVYGVNIDLIHHICESGRSIVREPIANGKAPIPGRDAEINYYHEKPTPAPQLTDDGKANYYELGQLVLVNQGDVIASKIPATTGENGYNIFGEPIQATPGRNHNFAVGKGVVNEGENAVAEFDGALAWEANKVYVTRLYTVRGDVDFSVGNINFPGKVLILGYVREGFRVEAEEDIEIRGGVEGSEVISKRGSIYVRAGIIGKDRAIIKAHGNVEARFIQEADVHAGKNLVVNEYIIRSNIRANDSVLIQGMRGKILGDNSISAGTKIKANAIQTDKGVNLQVEGINRDALYQRVKDIQERLEDLDREMREMAIKARLLGGKKDPEAIQQLKQTISRYVHLSEETDLLKEERQDILSILKTTKGEGMIEVRGQVDIGLSFRIKHESVLLKEPMRNITMYFDHQEKRIVILNN